MTAYGFLAVGVGGALGCWLRWLLGIALNPLFPNMLMGTLAANLTGDPINTTHLNVQFELPPSRIGVNDADKQR